MKDRYYASLVIVYRKFQSTFTQFVHFSYHFKKKKKINAKNHRQQFNTKKKVCKNWYDAFYLPQVWSSFFVDDQTLTRSKFNYYSGWQFVLDHFRTQNCLNQIGTFIRGLDMRPLHSFNNLYQFMTLISWYMEQVGSE